MKFGPREMIVLVLLLAVPIGAWWFVFKPQNAQNALVRQEIEAKQDKLKALNRAVSTIGNLRKEIDSLNAAVAFFQSKLPSEKEIDKVLQEVWLLAERNELKTKSIRTLKRSRSSAGTPAGPHAEQPIAMELEGDFMGFYTFLQALENQPRIMRIHELTIENDLRRGKGHVKASFTMSVFFEPAEKDRT